MGLVADVDSVIRGWFTGRDSYCENNVEPKPSSWRFELPKDFRGCFNRFFDAVG